MSRGLIEATWLDCVNRLEPEFSAVMSRGLIEALYSSVAFAPAIGFSAVMSRGLIEAGGIRLEHQAARWVFRGDEPRPH